MLAIVMLLGSVVSAAALDKSVEGVLSQEEWQVLKIVNQNRMASGLAPLSATAKLQKAADTRANELSALFDHNRPDGRQYHTALTDLSIAYNRSGENIAAGQNTAESVMTAWMKSQGHKDNIMSTGYKHMGAGYQYNAGSLYKHNWAQLFVSSNSCSHTGLMLNNAAGLNVKSGTAISDLDLVLQYNCGVYGSCYLPVIDKMCTGYNKSKPGSQTVTVNYEDKSITFDITVTGDSAVNSVPTGLRAFAPSVYKGNDGRITGTDSSMEYRAESSQSYRACTGSSVKGLTAGGYFVRYKATESKSASAEVRLELPAAAANNATMNQQYINGYDNGSFRPESQMTRAEVAMMFYNMLNDQGTASPARFVDVDNGKWYARAVNKLAEMGVIGGYKDGSFKPEVNITRAEFTKIAATFLKMKPASTKKNFVDVQQGEWYYDLVRDAAGHGWIQGYDGGLFKPNKTITRAEAVTIVNRITNRIPDKVFIDSHPGELNSFFDINKNHWAYYNVIDAANERKSK